MRIKVIACKVLYKEIGLLSAKCPNFLDITYLRQGYHNEPNRLHEILQTQIDNVDSGDDPYTCDVSYQEIDAIVLGYGLCCNGVVGIKSKKYPIIIPRAHDCITLFLGSKQRYKDYFDNHPGTFWYTSGWIDNTLMPSSDYYKTYYDMYLEKYGEDNAEYLAEQQLVWLDKYNNAAYIAMNGVDEGNNLQFTKDSADYLKWNFSHLDGDLSLLEKMLWGNWNEDDFIMIPPNCTVEPSYDDKILKIIK